MTMQRPSPRFMSFAAAVLLCAAPALTFAQPASLVKVENAWLRPAVAGAGGVEMIVGADKYPGGSRET